MKTIYISFLSLNIDAPSISIRLWPRIVPRGIILDISYSKYIISAASLMLYQSPFSIFIIVFDKKRPWNLYILLFCPISPFRKRVFEETVNVPPVRKLKRSFFWLIMMYFNRKKVLRTITVLCTQTIGSPCSKPVYIES